MFPSSVDYQFWINKKIPNWYKGRLPIGVITPDILVNAHADIKIPNYINNDFYLFRLWRENRKREGNDYSLKTFCEYIVSSGMKNQEERFRYCKRILRKYNKKKDKISFPF